MAIYHARFTSISRAAGHSAIAAAAYRAGVALTDERTGLKHDYSRRRGVECVRVLAPSAAPAWACDGARLWNAAEAAEKRKNSRVARELIVALPHELSAEQRVKLAENIGQLLVSRYGVAAMLAVHAPDARGDQRNHHAHVLFTTRALGPKGFGAKVRILDDRDQGPREIESLRHAVADLINGDLAAAGSPERVDARSLRAQARAAEVSGDFARAAMLTREPTEHVGPVETAAARRGQSSERVAANAARHADHQAALASFLRRAEAEGRLMPVASDRGPRATGSVLRVPRRSLRPSLPGRGVLAGPTRGTRAEGQDAALLNAQAALWEDGVRVEREASQAYLDGLRRSAEQSAALVDAYLAVAGRPSERPRLLEQCARDPVWVERLRRSLEARAELRALSKELPERRRQYGRAMAATADAQRALDGLEAQRPPAWRALSRRQWAEKRRAERARLGQVQRVERAARSMTTGAGAEALKERGRALRAEIRGIERERRETFRTKASHPLGATDEAPVAPIGRPRANRSLSRRLTP